MSNIRDKVISARLAATPLQSVSVSLTASTILPPIRTLAYADILSRKRVRVRHTHIQQPEREI